MKYYVYILKTIRNTLYCGITPDIKKRFELHQKGQGAKYTRANKPVSVEYLDIFDDKSSALKEEYRIKKTLTREKKLKFIEENREKTNMHIKVLFK